MNIKVLLIDDEEETICKKLQRNAKDESIEITYFCNYEAGFAELNRSFSQYHALVLDAKCWKTQAEQDNDHNPTDDALSEGLRLLAEFEHKTQCFLPVAVYTGFDFPQNYLSPQLNAIKARIFRKGTDHAELFTYLKETAAHSDTYRIERKYADVLAVFENAKYTSIKNDALAYLKDLENDGLTRDTLVNIRKVYDSLRNDFPTLQPDNIHPLTKAIWSVGSFYLHKNAPLPSPYLIKSLGYALLDVLLWFKATLKN